MVPNVGNWTNTLVHSILYFVECFHVFLYPWRFRSRTVLARSNHVHLRPLVLISIGIQLARWQESWFCTQFGQNVCCVCQRHPFVRVWILQVVIWVRSQAVHLYRITDFILQLKILIFVLKVLCLGLQILYSKWKTHPTLFMHVFVLAFKSSFLSLSLCLCSKHFQHPERFGYLLLLGFHLLHLSLAICFWLHWSPGRPLQRIFIAIN